jgi:hypothetical protein
LGKLIHYQGGSASPGLPNLCKVSVLGRIQSESHRPRDMETLSDQLGFLVRETNVGNRWLFLLSRLCSYEEM